jgi:hypothetical protein
MRLTYSSYIDCKKEVTALSPFSRTIGLSGAHRLNAASIIGRQHGAVVVELSVLPTIADRLSDAGRQHTPHPIRCGRHPKPFTVRDVKTRYP